MTSPPKVTIHADESCLGNQFKDRANPGGAAGLVELWRGGRWIRRDYWIAEPDTTNNRMAIRSAIEGGVRRVHVISQELPDSLLLEVFTNEGTGTLVVADTGSLTAAEQGVDKNG